MSKRPIPQLPAGDEAIIRVLRALKENQEEQMGMRGGKPLEQLSTSATTSEIITALNSVIARLQ